MIADGTHVRALGGLPTSLTDAILDPFFGPAGVRLKSWVGDEAYDDAASGTPQDSVRAEALKDAEAYLVLFFAAPRINMVIDNSGIISYKTTGTTSDQFTYLTPAQLERLRETWLQDAVSACRPYIINVGATVGHSGVVDES